MRALVLMVMFACGTPPLRPMLANESTTPAPTTVVRGFEIKLVVERSAFMDRLLARAARDRMVGVAYPSNEEYLTGGKRDEIERYVAKLAAADPAFRVPRDHELAFQYLPGRIGGSWRSFYLTGADTIKGEMIDYAHGSMDPSTTMPIVVVNFKPAGSLALAKLTEKEMGTRLAILVGGTVRAVFVVILPITNGQLQFVLRYADDDTMLREASELAEAINKTR